jgi:hypothetical protein
MVGLNKHEFLLQPLSIILYQIAFWHTILYPVQMPKPAYKVIRWNAVWY